MRKMIMSTDLTLVSSIVVDSNSNFNDLAGDSKKKKSRAQDFYDESKENLLWSFNIRIDLYPFFLFWKNRRFFVQRKINCISQKGFAKS